MSITKISILSKLIKMWTLGQQVVLSQTGTLRHTSQSQHSPQNLYLILQHHKLSHNIFQYFIIFHNILQTGKLKPTNPNVNLWIKSDNAQRASHQPTSLADTLYSI